MLIIPANSLSSGFSVNFSCRFNDGSSDYFNRTNVGTVTDNKKFTLSQWIKRDTIGTNQRLYGCADTSPGGLTQEIYSFGTDNKFYYQHRLSGADVSYRSTTNPAYTSTSVWYHLVLAVDTTQGTSTNRVKIYVDGTQVSTTQSGYPSSAYIPQNNPVWINYASQDNQLGALAGNSTFDGNMAEVVLIDGQQLDPTSFGEDDDGTWKPIDVSDLTFGNNGAYLEFKQTGTGQNSSGLGADTSGNDNHYGVNNLTSGDQSTDTPTSW